MKIKMVSDIFHNVTIMIDRYRKKQLLFSWRIILGLGQMGVGLGNIQLKPFPSIFLRFLPNAINSFKMYT